MLNGGKRMKIKIEEGKTYLTDVFNNIIEMPFEDLHQGLKPGEKLKCKVTDIRKGQVYLNC